MHTITYHATMVLAEELLNGYLSVTDGRITYVGTERPDGDVVELTDGIIAPGFIDIHCHTSLRHSAVEDPCEVADFHRAHGTTTMLLTYYRDIPHEELLACLARTKEAMSCCSNLYGAHLEGPYLNANLGYGQGVNDSPDPTKYEAYIASGVVRQWTCAPEIEGTPAFIARIASAGIVPAIGHSTANYDQVKTAYEHGARIATHLFDATGTPETRYLGTLEVTFNEACMLMDDLFCEVICDSQWIHVRREKLALLVKTVGADRIVAITDMYSNDIDDGLDVNLIDGMLCGTKLTMDRVAVNLFNAGYSLPTIFKMTSRNPARALGLSDRGEIAVGKRADLILINRQAIFQKLL